MIKNRSRYYRARHNIERFSEYLFGEEEIQEIQEIQETPDIDVYREKIPSPSIEHCAEFYAHIMGVINIDKIEGNIDTILDKIKGKYKINLRKNT